MLPSDICAIGRRKSELRSISETGPNRDFVAGARFNEFQTVSVFKCAERSKLNSSSRV